VDTTTNQKNRVTIYVMMPPGYPKEHYRVQIANGGSEVVVEYQWPEKMLDASILMKGHN
jgi:hypothetical protein